MCLTHRNTSNMDGCSIHVPPSCCDVTSCDDIKPLWVMIERTIYTFQFLFFYTFWVTRSQQLLIYQTSGLTVNTFFINAVRCELHTQFQVFQNVIMSSMKSTFKYAPGEKINPSEKLPFGWAESPLPRWKNEPCIQTSFFPLCSRKKLVPHQMRSGSKCSLLWWATGKSAGLSSPSTFLHSSAFYHHLSWTEAHREGWAGLKNWTDNTKEKLNENQWPSHGSKWQEPPK